MALRRDSTRARWRSAPGITYTRFSIRSGFSTVMAWHGSIHLRDAHMKPYQHGDYSLYARDVELKNNNGTHRIYFFARNTPKSGQPAEMPDGYRVAVSERTGLPLLKKASNGEDAGATPNILGSVRKFFT
jgi:hypothetical protein